MDDDIFKAADELFRRRLQAPELDPDAPLVNYGLDSVRSIELIVEMEVLFGVQISDEEAASMRTLRDVVTKIVASLPVRAGQAFDDL